MIAANPRMVKLVRESRSWSQGHLAQAAEVTQGYVSKVESGLVELTGARLSAIAAALECPVAVLGIRDAQQGPEVSCMFHRRRRSRMTASVAKRVEAIGHLTRISVDALLERSNVEYNLDRMPLGDYEGDPARVASALRARWNVPRGPIENLHALMDDVGIVIVVRGFDAVAQDAFSTWPEGKAPLMVVRDGLSADREGFSICHELGHIVMHVVPTDDQEQEADLFAAEFLAPAAEIGPQLTGLTTRDFKRLMDLKQQWRLSIGALIQRAKTLDAISDRQFREFRVKLSQLGWNTVEPAPVPRHRAHLLETVLASATADCALTDLPLLAAETFLGDYYRTAITRREVS
ncbi:XRE family transcriptional regulator [Mycobacterium antarcticum]|uniref:helix-turn-helix domain-containing protein n=1 Tax=Mycolicibacterium sp. TUM20983 TaxID=3023369 RepID=UPI002391A6AD|nr:XRE family transcriptional regulator [Mycolicibacterium sp. TUM20983]GLP76392.1 XRE family transcriptional regulator [Mycolicibacterium sp. TUM20983]